MDTRNIADTRDGPSSETRLDIFRLLVRAGAGDGLAVGVIAERLGISASTLAFHLRSLVGAGLLADALKPIGEPSCFARGPETPPPPVWRFWQSADRRGQFVSAARTNFIFLQRWLLFALMLEKCWKA